MTPDAESERTIDPVVFALGLTDPGVPGDGVSDDAERVQAAPTFATGPEAGSAPEAPAAAEAPRAPKPKAAPKPKPAPRIVHPTPLQVENDPLLGASGAVFRDLREKLRLAATCYGALGVIATWLIALMIGIGTANASAFAWAGGATLLIALGAYWYLTLRIKAFSGKQAYGASIPPRALARLDHPSVVGIIPLIGGALGAALAGLAGVGVVIALFYAAASPWLWLIAGVCLALLYVYGFVLLALRILERVRDAVA